MNLKNVMAALMVATMSLTVAPFATAHTGHACTDTTALPSAMTDKGDAIGDSGAGAIRDDAAGEYYRIVPNANDRDLVISGAVQFRVIKDNAACSEVQAWTDLTASNQPFSVDLDGSATVGYFIILKPLSESPPEVGPYSFAAA